MKNKMSGGKKLVTIDNIQIRFLQQNKKNTKNNNNNNRQDPDQVSKGLGNPQHLAFLPKQVHVRPE